MVRARLREFPLLLGHRGSGAAFDPIGTAFDNRHVIAFGDEGYRLLDAVLTYN
jgi:hypothetical protein